MNARASKQARRGTRRREEKQLCNFIYLFCFKHRTNILVNVFSSSSSAFHYVSLCKGGRRFMLIVAAVRDASSAADGRFQM